MKQNLQRIYDKKGYDVYQRACTFDGEEYLSKQNKNIGDQVTREIDSVCKEITAHTSAISVQQFKIAKAIYYFKIGLDGVVWFLYCTSIRIRKHATHVRIFEADFLEAP